MGKFTKTNQINEELVLAIQSGANDRILELWEQVSGLVKWHANRVFSAMELQGNCRGLEFDDLLQTGFIAMLEAVDTFKPESGTFSTWLTFHIHSAFAEVSDYRTKCRRNDPINSALSLDTPLSDDSESATMYEIIPDSAAVAALEAVEERIYQEQLHETLEDVLSELPEKRSKVLRLRYYQNQTLAEVGNMVNVSPEMARQLEKML